MSIWKRGEICGVVSTFRIGQLFGVVSHLKAGNRPRFRRHCSFSLYNPAARFKTSAQATGHDVGRPIMTTSCRVNPRSSWQPNWLYWVALYGEPRKSCQQLVAALLGCHPVNWGGTQSVRGVEKATAYFPSKWSVRAAEYRFPGRGS